MAIRRFTFRLYPNKEQESKLFEARRLHCYLYNACIAHRQYEWKANQKSVSYFDQQNCLPEFKQVWEAFASLHSQSLQATVKRVDFAYQSFFKGLRGKPKFKSIRNYSGWTYSAKSGWKANTNGKHGSVTLNDLGINIKMRGQAKSGGVPTTLTLVYRPSRNQWFASFSVNVETPESRFGKDSKLEYESVVAFDLGTKTALTLYNGEEFSKVENPRFTQKAETQIKKASKALRQKRAPNRKKKIKPSRRWKKARKRVSQLQRKVANQRRDWQHKVTSEISRHHDIGVTEKLHTRGMTRKAKKRCDPGESNSPSGQTPVRFPHLAVEGRRIAFAKSNRPRGNADQERERAPRQGSKRKRQKAGLNKSILSVGFGMLNQMLTYKIEAKGGLMLVLPTRKLKPSQRCPNCGKVHKDWAELSNRYHVCDACKFEIERDKGSVMVMYNAALNKQPGDGISPRRLWMS